MPKTHKIWIAVIKYEYAPQLSKHLGNIISKRLNEININKYSIEQPLINYIKIVEVDGICSPRISKELPVEIIDFLVLCIEEAFKTLRISDIE